jgi:replicative DNA helicase
MFGDRTRAALEELDRLQAGDFSAYVSTGIPSLDMAFGGGGLRRGEVTLVGAPTGSGKTTLVVQMAMAAQEKGLAIIVSPEMSATDLVVREIVRRSGVPKWRRAPWASAVYRDAACRAHIEAYSKLQQKPPRVALYDAPMAALDDALQAIRTRAEAEPVSFVAFDYAQQLADEDGKTARYLQVGQVAYRSIELAKELGCAVVVTSQVNTVKDGKSKDYTMRESAVLEQKAASSLIFAVERDDLGKVISAEFIAKKVRDGAMFRLPVRYDPATFSISDLEKPLPEAVEIRDWTVKS